MTASRTYTRKGLYGYLDRGGQTGYCGLKEAGDRAKCIMCRWLADTIHKLVADRGLISRIKKLRRAFDANHCREYNYHTVNLRPSQMIGIKKFRTKTKMRNPHAPELRRTRKLSANGPDPSA